MHRLARTLERIDAKGYKAYKDLSGAYDFPTYRLHIDHVQADPFAAPSRLRISVPITVTGLDPGLSANRSRKTALTDFLIRSFERRIREIAQRRRGIGLSGLIAIDRPGQEILERTACVIDQGMLEVRFGLGLPAQGRTIQARQAQAMLFDELPRIASGLFAAGLDVRALEAHVNANEDQDHLRGLLEQAGLVAFVADGAVLPRLSGIDERPLEQGRAVAFLSPESLSVTLPTLHHGEVTGTGVPSGVTLIVGGGFHGKSTLLRALERGVYNHIPGDGRELVVTRADAVKIRAEDGRAVAQVDISPFITTLPGGLATTAFSTENASGSTSQAANIMEALEVGSRLLLIDEDTSATNFMIRDARMQALVAKAKEPITPFVDKVRELWDDLACSTILVMGGSGDYFDVADTVLMMDNYHLADVTEAARAIARRIDGARVHEGSAHFGDIAERAPTPASFPAPDDRRAAKIGARGRARIILGRAEIDITALEQLLDEAQARAIAGLVQVYARDYAPRGVPLLQGLTAIMGRIEKEGLLRVLPPRLHDGALPRLFETAAAVNRLRGLRLG